MNLPQNVRVMQQANNYVSQATVKELRARPFFEDAIVFAKVGAAISHERKRIAPSPFLIDNNMMAFTPKQKEDLEFIYHLFQRIKLSKYSQIGALPSYNASDILDIRTFYPTSKSERNKIVTILNLVSNRIEKQSEMITNLKKYKRGVTNAIFNKDLSFASKETTYPKWEQKYIGEICKIQTGKSNTQDETVHGRFPFYVRSPIVRKSNRYLFDCEAVLTVGDGVGTGKVFHHVTGKFDLHQRVYAMTDFKLVSGKYFYYYFSNFFYDRVMRMTAKTSVDSVRYEMIDRMPILIPCKEEQCQIVRFLNLFEKEVRNAEEKLTLLEKFKSGFLQQLFI